MSIAIQITEDNELNTSMLLAFYCEKREKAPASFGNSLTVRDVFMQMLPYYKQRQL